MFHFILSFYSEQTDYLVFVGCVAVLFATLAVVLSRRSPQARLPWPAWALAAALVLGSWWSVQGAGDAAREKIEHSVSALAPTYARELEHLGHSQITLATPPEDPLYLSLIEAEKRWQRANPAANDIYTMRKRADGKNVFIVDSESDYDHSRRYEGEREVRTEIGKVFEEEDAGLELAFAGHGNFDKEIIADEWGAWVSAWVPIYTPEGKLDAVLGVDYDAREWLAAIRSARHGALFRFAALLALVAMAGAAGAMLRADLVRHIATEAMLRKADERMRLTIQQMPVAFIEWTTEGKVAYWNPAAERIFGFKAAEALGTTIMTKIVAPSAISHVGKVWAELLSQTGGYHSINENVTKDGKSIVCEWMNTAIQQPDGKVIGVFSITQDLSERLSLERHVQKAERLNAIGQLAAGVAHDFNNILTVISGHAGLLLTLPELPESARTELESMEEAAMRAAGLTRQLLAFSSQQPIFTEPLHLGALVGKTTKMLSRVLGGTVTLALEVEESARPIEADPGMIEQALTNLVLNARDALPRGGEISIGIKGVQISEEEARDIAGARAGWATCLSVQDYGVGIHGEHLARLFEPFFTTKQIGKGTGLGLSVVHGIVKQHGGWADVESTPAKGTIFRLFFPATEKMPGSTPARTVSLREKPTSGVKNTILVVEDEMMVRELTQMILERSGFRVIAAEDAANALRVWAERKEEIDLLLTDIRMPGGMNGRELAQQILAEKPTLPVVYASGYTQEFTDPDFRETPRQVFLHKPYLTDQLISTIRRCLRADAA